MHDGMQDMYKHARAHMSTHGYNTRQTVFITLINQYNEHLAPPFYVEKSGLYRENIIFLILVLRHRFWVLARTASSKISKIIN